MISRSSLTESLHRYQSDYPEEAAFKEQFAELLAHPRAFFRDHLPGHITASSWIMDETRHFTLLTHHAKLNRWLQPGGHADGDENVLRVAEREAREETGLTSLRVNSDQIFDIDIHTIPAREVFPEHLHYDIRFFFQAALDEPFTLSQESRDMAWIPVSDLTRRTGNNVSILRMAEKATNLFRTDQQ